jgi:HK97 family phage major capsid protein
MAGIDINRTSSGVNLPSEVSAEIWADTQEQSAVMRLARQIRVPGSGLTIPIITGDATADWVDETDAKPVSRATLDNKSLTPYKLAVVEPFSNEFRRDLPALYGELQRRLPGAIAKKFDATVFGTSAPGSNFDTIGGATAVKLKPKSADVTQNTYAGLVEAYTTVAGNNGTLNGWALSSQAKGLLLGQVDTTGRPLLLDSIQNGSAVPQLLGEPAYYTQGVYASGTPNTVGFAGDWSSAVWGTVEGIKVDISNQATLVDGTTTLTTAGDDTVDVPNFINLWQRNMFAVLVEVEIGFRVRNTNLFVKLTDAVRS